MYILTYDLGTTGNKCTLFNRQGEMLRSVTVPYQTYYPKPGWAEQVPDDYWRSTLEATRQILQGDGDRIEAIGLCGHMNGCIAVDRNGRALHNDIIHSDGRTTDECAWMAEQLDPDSFFHITGNRIDPHYTLPKMLWLQKHYPNIYQNTASFLCSKDYLAAQLTGRVGVTDPSMASLMGALDMADSSWADAVVERLELDMAKLPALMASTDVVGGLTVQAAEALGLRRDLPVILGGGDGACATKGAGVVSVGQAYNYIGSSSWISTLADNPCFDQRLFHYADLDGKHVVVCGTVQNAGAAYDWAAELLTSDMVGTLHEKVHALMEGSVPGSRGLLFAPYLMGERSPHWDSEARGAWVGLSNAHGKAEMMRAVLEGVAYSLRNVLDCFDDNDLPVETVALLGGGARNSDWNRVMADIYGRAIQIHAQPGEATSMGSAMATAVGIGWCKDFEEAAQWVSYTRRLEPMNAAVYKSGYRGFNQLYEALKYVRQAMEEE